MTLPRFVLTTALCLVASIATAQEQTFGATLTGSQEVPPADPDGFGTATVTLDASRESVRIRVNVAGIGSTISASHVHAAAAGVNGSVVIGIGNNYSNGQIEVTVPISLELGNQIASNPAAYYVNVHTPTYPGGAVRGQLALINPTVLGGDLLGSREVPDPGSTTAFGAFTLSFNEARTQMTYELVTNLANASAAHIHDAPAGQSSGVVVALATSASAFTNGRVRGTVAVTPLIATQIINNPAGFYVNVHSPDFQAGAIRGQIAPVSESDIAVIGKVTNSLGETFITDVRIFNPSYTEAAIVLIERFVTASTSGMASQSGMVQINPRSTEVLDDIISSAIFQTGSIGGPVTGTGSARVTSRTKVAVTSRIFADKRSTNRGTIGQFFPGLPRAAALRRGILPHLSHTPVDPANLRGFRTNLGFFNPNDVVATVRLEVRDAAGAIVGSATTTLAPKNQTQNALMGGWFADATERANLTVSFDSNVPVFAYASVVDNVSTDPIAVLAQEDPQISSVP